MRRRAGVKTWVTDRGFDQPGETEGPLAVDRVDAGHSHGIERRHTTRRQAARRQGGEHAVVGVLGVEHRRGDAPVGQRHLGDLFNDFFEVGETEVGSQGLGQLDGDLQSDHADPGATSFWPSRLTRPSMLVVVPARSWVTAAGSTTCARSVVAERYRSPPR